MSKLPAFFRNSGDPAIASYQFIDIAEGTGIIEYMGARLSGAVNYILTTNPIYSDLAFTQVSTSGTTTILDADFDVTFNLPKVINGNLVANIPLTNSGSGTTNQLKATVDVMHYDGTTETSLASGATLGPVTNGATPTHYSIRSIALDVPKTNFKQGDTLRIRVLAESVGSNTVAAVGHDPAARTISDQPTMATSRMSFYVPFDLDL